MARGKTSPDGIRNRLAIAKRMSSLRAEMFGERGRATMARRLGLPLRTWYNYEKGTAIPAEVVLSVIELTSVEPAWLLRERGPKYNSQRSEESDCQTEFPPNEHPERRHVECLTAGERELCFVCRNRNISPDMVIDMLTEFYGADRTAGWFPNRADRPSDSNGVAKVATKRTSKPKKTA
jgi:hypothetical protein